MPNGSAGLPRRVLPVFVLVGLLTVCLSGCGGSNSARIASGEGVFTEHCATCHQVDGEGYAQVYPNLAGNPIVLLPDPAPVVSIVLHGRASMPGFAEELAPSQVAEVVSYVRAAWGNDASGVTAAQAR